MKKHQTANTERSESCGTGELPASQVSGLSPACDSLGENRDIPTQKNLKISLRCVGLDTHATWHDLVMEELRRLKSLTDIEAAEVILEQQRESAPACHARVLQLVPMPDFHAEAMDCTPAAALHKAVDNLVRQIRAHQTKYACGAIATGESEQFRVVGRATLPSSVVKDVADEFLTS